MSEVLLSVLPGFKPSTTWSWPSATRGIAGDCLRPWCGRPDLSGMWISTLDCPGRRRSWKIQGTSGALPELQWRLPSVHGDDADAVAFDKTAVERLVQALWIIFQSDKGLSSVRLAEAIGVSQPTAWRTGHALRLLVAKATGRHY